MLDPQGELALTFDNVLKTLTCGSCNKPFIHPVTLDCGNTLCLACLPETLDSSSKHCNPHGTHVDVTLAKLTKICLETEIKALEPTISNSEESPETRFSKLYDLLSLEFECQICYQIFHEPVTTVCGHTFCYECLLRTHDHNSSCPMCRHQLDYSEISRSSINFTLSRLVSLCLPEVVLERKRQLDQNAMNEHNEVPLFVCSLVFPGMPCQLHIFEPRYRLMIRRIMMTRTHQFGMLLAGKNGKPFVEYGTMVRIKSIDALPDGRSLIQTIGLYRFRVLNHSSHDGYFIGGVERISDDPVIPANPTPNSTQVTTVEEMVDTIKCFINTLRNGSAPWLLQRLDKTYGAMPSQPEEFSYWAASIIPIEEYEKYKLLTTTNTELRLRMILHWTQRFKEQWWFSCGGCATIGVAIDRLMPTR
ncbi:hypothetical protein K493DRAFT_23153 [Basidiobolus meristosporus CBS 931.73]|uniref:LON-domain-containing protein n=1 Tax=Basidiobolus meristosporus CBS 931.73 TaxID=1314790 RepID=A0A1Y1Z7M1_9FUNG|nr:hypothetical protein K493DRAFT_23153 [Basidiobolus meristosporus CBS 931.73]|eukprot:ORY06272.1 hypothetical protein K493DRAFT_23153 [Basidiobolus meristosporus CBS 931.73]